MNEHRRKGEPEGKKLTPGERAINWAKAASIIIPLFGAGVLAGNTQTVKQYLPDFAGEVDEPTSEDIHPEVKQKLTRIIELLNEHKAEFVIVYEEIDNTKALSQRDDGGLNERLVAIEELVN